MGGTTVRQAHRKLGNNAHRPIRRDWCAFFMEIQKDNKKALIMYSNGAIFEPGGVLRGELVVTSSSTVYEKRKRPGRYDPLAAEVYTSFNLNNDILGRMRPDLKREDQWNILWILRE